MSAPPLVEIADLAVAYGGAVRALSGISLTISAGDFQAVIGSNGAGKTTLVRSIMGLLTYHGGSVTAGDVRLDGRSIVRTSTRSIVAGGVALVPEGRILSPGLSVRENLLCGAATRGHGSRTEGLDYVYGLFPAIAGRSEQKAGYLSGGEQQMVAIGRALMSDPRLLICDELSLGLAPMITRELFEALQRLNSDQGLTILVIEQNARLALEAADYAYVLTAGSLVRHGTSERLRRDDDIQRHYLGGSGPATAGDNDTDNLEER